MAQEDFGNLVTLDPSGTELGELLNLFRNAVNSNHSGAVRPSYAVAGMFWVKEVSGTRHELNLFDGTNDIMMLAMNPAIHTIIDAAPYLLDASNLNAGTLPHARIPKATQAQAEAGTSTTVMMTPQRVKQAIDELADSGMTAAEILAALITVGGAGSGLDSDTVDGKEASQFLRSDTANTKIQMGSGATDNFDGIIFDDGGNTFTFVADGEDDGSEVGSSVVHAGKVRIHHITDATNSSTGHGFQIGADDGARLVIDNNEIMALNGGAPATLYLNSGSGEVQVNSKAIATAVPDYEYYKSSWTVNAAFTLAHGLGVIPRRCEAVYVCKVANNGWSVGDEVEARYSSSSALGVLLARDTSLINVGVRSVYLLLKSATSSFTVNSSTNWGIKIRVWK